MKALLYASVGTKQLLISGGADAVILIWDAQTGEKLHALKGHARGVQTLALDPLSLPEDGPTTESITFFSGDSSREIRCWSLTPTHAVEVDSRGGTEISPLMAHETSVYTLRFDADGDLWTASADKAAKCLVRNRSWEADMELVHPDFVRDVIVDEEGGWVVTACRDEEVRLWERAVRFPIA